MQIIFLIIMLVFIVIALALAAKNNVNMIYFCNCSEPLGVTAIQSRHFRQMQPLMPHKH